MTDTDSAVTTVVTHNSTCSPSDLNLQDLNRLAASLQALEPPHCGE
jgi:hypothetical protein